MPGIWGLKIKIELFENGLYQISYTEVNTLGRGFTFLHKADISLKA